MWEGKKFLWSLFSIHFPCPPCFPAALACHLLNKQRSSHCDPHLSQFSHCHNSHYLGLSNFCNSLNIPAISHLLAFVPTNTSLAAILFWKLRQLLFIPQDLVQITPLELLPSLSPSEAKFSSLLQSQYYILYLPFFFFNRLYDIIFTHVSIN